MCLGSHTDTPCGTFARLSSSTPPLHSNAACMNRCSKCYREYVADAEREKKSEELVSSMHQVVAPPQVVVAQQQQQQPMGEQQQPAAREAAAAPEATAQPAAPEASAAGDASAAEGGGLPLQANTSRCFTCNKRVGLTGFKCRCSYVYCATHRYAEKHDCCFDYKSAGRAQVQKNNPHCVAAKIEKF